VQLCGDCFDVQVPFEVRNQQQPGEESEVRHGTIESIKVKMLLLGRDDAPQSLRLEFSSEADLFFHYMHIIDESGYRAVQQAQKLMVEFADYPNVLIRMLNHCIKEPHVYLAVYTMIGESDARLDFIQNMEYKFVELMSCMCIRSPEEIVQQHITFRYNSMKQRLAIMGSRLHEISNLVKTKNPSLLLQLQKSQTQEGRLVGPGQNISSGASVSSDRRR
jgi:hypothetical protein